MNSTLVPQVEFQEGEEVKYKVEQIPLKITSLQTENFAIFSDGILCITNQRVVFANGDQKTFQLEYKNVISHGIQENNLVCYLANGQGNENNEEEEEYDEEEEKSYLQFLTNSKNDMINLQGDFEVRFSFGNINNTEDLKNTFNFFSECSALNPDGEDDESHVANLLGGMTGFAGFDFDSMVTAKDIDENGNLIPKQFANGQENHDDEEDVEEYTDDDECDEDNEENNDGDQNKNEKNGDKMDLE